MSTGAVTIEYKKQSEDDTAYTETAPKDAGDYTVRVTVAEDDDYTAASATADFTISKKALSITADDKSITYGDAAPAYTVTYDGFVSGEDYTVLSDALVFTCSYSRYGDKGEYVITPSGYASSNYDITYVSGTLKVNPKEIIVTIDNKTSIYGDDIATLTAEVTDGSVVNGDTDIYSLSTTASSESVVGTYDITGKVENSNYSITFVNEADAYTITARELTVTVTVADKVYDGTNTATIESAELNNIANNDDVTLKNGTAIFDGVNIGSDIAITFTDDFSLEGEASVLANYTLTQPAGVTADITKIPVTITVDDVIRDYGDDNPTFTYTITDGELFGDDTEDDLSITLSTDADADSAVGSYTVSGTSDSDRYDVTIVDGTLTVVVLTDLPEQEFPDDGAIHKIAIELGNLKVPDSFKNNPNLNTVEKIEAVLKTIISKQSGYSETNVVVYELTLVVSYDGGLTWEVATEENFPEDGLTVILPYPDGTGKDTHDFTVVHMFTSTAFGKTPGDTETPEVTKKDEGIQVTVTGLSPIAIGWTEIVSEAEPATEITTDTTEAEEVTETETAAETDSVNTGDNTPIWLCWIMMAVSGIGIIGICAYRRRKRR